MRDLGSFGTPKPALDPEQVDSFGYFDVRVRVNPAFGELDLVDFFELLAGIDESDEAQASAALKRLFRECIHPGDFDSFWSTAKRERQELDDLMGVVQAVASSVADRPTVRPSDSSVGPSSTSTSSVGVSSSRVIARLEGQGRPDLAVMVSRAEESRVSA